MEPNEYQKLAAKTECDQAAARERLMAFRPYQDIATSMDSSRLFPVRMNHALMGMAGEVGELATAIENWLQYGRPLDVVNIKEELGDLLWYMALMCNASHISLEEVMEANIAKLQRRFPHKYSDHDAAEENRDRGAEREALSE